MMDRKESNARRRLTSEGKQKRGRSLEFLMWLNWVLAAGVMAVRDSE